MPKKKRLPERERRRIATRRQRFGGSYNSDDENPRRAGLQTPTKFNSMTGKIAAQKRWKKYREEKAKNIPQRGTL